MTNEASEAPNGLGGTRLSPTVVVVAVLLLLASGVVSVLIGSADIAPSTVITDLLAKVPFLSVHATGGQIDFAIIWQIRVPRIVLGGLVGATLAMAGATYQGVFQNPLADPYLLGVASGAGLGATLAIVYVHSANTAAINPIPFAAFAGAIIAVIATYALGRGGRARNATSLILAGVAVGAFFNAIQTYEQQRGSTTLNEVYAWIFGGLSEASWSQVWIVLPYMAVSATVIIGARRLLDVMAVGDEEAGALGINAQHVRLIVVGAATLATAAAVAVSGLIGFVGIIVPHTVRLFVGPSYRRILPLSIVVGAAFLILADLIARTILSPAEVPIGVVTAFVGAPFFLIVLRQTRREIP